MFFCSFVSLWEKYIHPNVQPRDTNNTNCLSVAARATQIFFFCKVNQCTDLSEFFGLVVL